MNSNLAPSVLGKNVLPETSTKRGRTALIPEADVIRIGEQMEADGKRVNGYLIRAEIGGAGRTDRYNEVWSRHVASRTAEVAEGSEEVVPTATLPVDIRTAIESGQVQIGAVLESLSFVAIKHAQDASADRIADADKRTADAESERAEIQAAGESAMDKTQNEIEALTGQLETAINAAHTSEDRAKQAEGVAADRGVKLREVQEAERQAHDEVTRLTTKLGEETARVGTLKSSVTDLRAKLAELEHRAIQAESQATSRQEAIEKLEANIGMLNSTVTELRTTLVEVERRAASAESQVVAHQEAIKKLEVDVTHQKESVQNELARSNAAQKRADEAQARADHANARANDELDRARKIDEEILAVKQKSDKQSAQIHDFEALVLELKAQLAAATILESKT